MEFVSGFEGFAYRTCEVDPEILRFLVKIVPAEGNVAAVACVVLESSSTRQLKRGGGKIVIIHHVLIISNPVDFVTVLGRSRSY